MPKRCLESSQATTQINESLNSANSNLLCKCFAENGSIFSLDFGDKEGHISLFVYLANWSLMKDDELMASSEVEGINFCDFFKGLSLKSVLCHKNRIKVIFDQDVVMIVEPEAPNVYESGEDGDDLISIFLKEKNIIITLNSLNGYTVEPIESK